MIEIERKASEKFLAIEGAKQNLKNIKSENQKDLELILKDMQNLEKKSEKIMKSALKS